MSVISLHTVNNLINETDQLGKKHCFECEIVGEGRDPDENGSIINVPKL